MTRKALVLIIQPTYRPAGAASETLFVDASCALLCCFSIGPDTNIISLAMATQEPIVDNTDQNHELGDEVGSRKSIDDKTQDEKEETTREGETAAEEDEDLEEGELKDDEDDDDEDDEDDDSASKRFPDHNNDNNNNSGFSKDSSYNDSRHDPHYQHPHHQNYPPQHSASGQQPPHSFAHHANRRLSPNSLQAEMHNQYPSNHHFSSNSNSNHYRYPPNDGPPQQTNHHPQSGGPDSMYPRGGPGGVGPMQKNNIRCRFYSKTSNKCTWGDHCRFEHRDDSPGPEFDTRPPPGIGGPTQLGRGPPPPMSAAERGPYPPYVGRHQPYQPPPPPHGYLYDVYGHHHSTPPPMPPRSMPHWRQQHSPYLSPSSAHPPESVSPALLPTPPGVPGGGGGRGPPAPPGSSGSSGGAGGGGGGPIAAGGASSPGYPSSSPSAVVYERKHRLAYELAPWNDRGYPPQGKYERSDPPGYPPGVRGFYRNHYSREPPYGREPPPNMSGPYPGYPTYPSGYRGGPTGPHASHYKFMSSSQRTVPPDTRRSRSNKRGHDEDESSWSDSGSEDSILGQANYGSRGHASKAAKQPPTTENVTSEEPLDQGSGTPPGEPLPEDRERQEMLLNKLKEIEDLMAKKKGEQEDPM